MTRSITLPSGYTKKDLFLAAIKVQLEKYKVNGEKDGQNTDNARIFESAVIEPTESGEIRVSTAEHGGESADAFNKYLADGAEVPEWTKVLKQHPSQNAEMVFPTKLQLANYLTSFVAEFKKLIPEIEGMLAEQKSLIVDSNLIFSFAVSLKNILTPRDPFPGLHSSIYSLFSILESRVLTTDSVASRLQDSFESCCDAIMHQISLIIAPPIGDEIAYGGTLGDGNNKNTMRDLLDADYGSEKYKEFIFPERYVIPSSCFDLEKKDDDRVLWQFLALNIEFVKQADPSQCHPLLYQASLQRLWNAFVQDKKCPQWIKDKSDKLCAKILALPTSILILFDGLDERIKQCDRTNPNGFQELLITLVTEILLTLSKSPDISTKEDMAKLLSGLIDIFEKEKTFHAKLCYVIINRAHTIIKNMKPEDVASSDAIEIACNDSDSLKEILLFVKEMVGSVTQNYSGITKDEKINLFKMLESLEGSVPKKYFAETMPQLIHEVILTYAKENKDEKLVTMVEKFLPDTVGFIEEDLKGIAKKINEIKNISIRQAMLIILTSRISTVEKLNCIGAVAKGKCERTSNVRKTATRRLYKELVHFYNVDENNFRKSLEEFKRPVSPTIVTGFSFFSSRTNSPETTPSTSPSDSPLFTSIKEFRA